MVQQSRKKLDMEFEEYYLSSSIPSMKVGLIITLLLFLVYTVFNRLLLSNVHEQDYFLRFGFIVPILLVSLIILFIKPLARYLPVIFIVLNLFSCFAIYYVGVSSDISDPGYNYFYAWVMLVMIGTHTLYRISFWRLIVLNIMQLFAYILATLINRSYNIPFFFINNLFFVVSMTSLGLFISYFLHSLSWKSFVHQKALTQNYHKLILESRDRKEAEDELVRSELQYHEALDSFPDWVIVVDRGLNIIMANSMLRQSVADAGLPSELKGRNLVETFLLLKQAEIDEMKAVFENGRISIGEISFEFRGQQFFVETRKIPIFHNNIVEQVMIVIRDRSKENEIELLKLRNAETKEIMLKEIHHRVKNNLAIVISLLDLQGRKNPDPNFQKLVREVELRIRSMALIHEHLYRSVNIDRIPLSNYIQSLVEIISGTFRNNKIRIEIQLDDILANIETALPIGLITNELLTNSYKYAFPEKQAGIITIKLEKYFATGFQLTISDNGVGLSEGFDLRKQDSLGMFIIKLLVEQMDGRIRITSERGVKASIIIPTV